MVADAMTLLIEHGWSVFFAFVCLCETVWLLKLLVWDRKELVKELEKERERTMAIASILERRNQLDVKLIEEMTKVTEAVTADQQIQKDFLTYLKIKDQYYRRLNDGPPPQGP